MSIKRTILPICVFVLFSLTAFAQQSLLQSGPMLGYNEMREVMLWVQTTKAAKVQISYWNENTPEQKQLTNSIQTEKRTAYTAKLIADEVDPGIQYVYQLHINDAIVSLPYPLRFKTQTDWAYKMDPPAFKVAIGSCTFINETLYDRPGKPYGGEYQIFNTIKNMKPEVMLWLGDNIYLRPADWNSRTGIMKRYTHTRSLPEMQEFLASTHHYAIWDDHDFGPNDSDRSFIHKDKTLEAFELFWGNPTFGLKENAGITTAFQYNDIDFFLLDNRYFRKPNHRKSGDDDLLGKEQREWLIDALASSRAPFKMVAIGGQVLSTAEIYENYAHHHKRERDAILTLIEKEGIKGVVFLTGDRHHTELSMYENEKGFRMFDLTVSPLTSGSGRGTDEPNNNRVKGTHVNQRNYGMLEFSGPRTERVLKMTIYDNLGKELWSKSIKAADFK